MRQSVVIPVHFSPNGIRTAFTERSEKQVSTEIRRDGADLPSK